MAGRKRANAGNGDLGRSEVSKLQTAGTVTTRLGKRTSLFNAVFLTTELLENILRHLPMEDLLISQRVCRKWREVITKNKELQQMLFFVPRESDLAWRVANDYSREWGDRIINIDKLTKPVESDSDDGNAHIMRRGQFNPMFFTQRQCKHDIWETLKADDVGGWFMLLKKFQRKRSQRTWTKHPEASWRRMLITQPPVMSYYYHWCCDNARGQLAHDRERYVQHVTLDHLMEHLDVFEDEEESPFDFASHFMSIEYERLVFPTDNEILAIDNFIANREAAAKTKAEEENEEQASDDNAGEEADGEVYDEAV